jgi:hypothetical protein
MSEALKHLHELGESTHYGTDGSIGLYVSEKHEEPHIMSISFEKGTENSFQIEVELKSIEHYYRIQDALEKLLQELGGERI